MPESIIQDKWVTQVPRYTLPPELTNPDAIPEKPEAKPEVKPAEPLKEAKPEVAEAATPKPEVEKPEADETTGKDPEKQTTRRFERRIDRAHRRAAEAQARAEFLEKEVAQLKAQSQPKTPTTAPRMEDYTDVQEYAKAYATYERDQGIREFQAKQQQDAHKAQVQRISEDWETQVSKASTKYDDWDEVVGEIKPTTPWAIAMMRSENGADIAYHFGSHPAETKKLLQMDPYQQILEIGRISVKLQQPAEKPKAPSAAPKPINPITPEAKPGGDDIRPEQPYEEYKKVGNKLFGRGRRS